MIGVECPNCQTRLSLDESLVGRRLRCPKCRKVLRVPELPADESSSFPPWLLALCGAGVVVLTALLLVAVLGLAPTLLIVAAGGAAVVVFMRGRQLRTRMGRAGAEVSRGAALPPASVRRTQGGGDLEGGRQKVAIPPEDASSADRRPVPPRAIHNESETPQQLPSGPDYHGGSSPSRIAPAACQPTGIATRQVSSRGDGLIEIQASEPGRSGVAVSPRSAPRSFTSSITRWISGPTQHDVQFFGSGTKLELEGTMLESPLVYHVIGMLSDAFDASLIESALPVVKSTSLHISRLPYWPSYRGCSPSQRRRYLTWLTSGRCDPDIEVGYVFIYFYGLERRVILDGADHAAIAQEVLRLLSLYGASNSFRGYSTKFLWLIMLTASDEQLSEQLRVEIVSQLDHWNQSELPALLAAYYRRRKALPPEIAFMVAEHDPRSPRGVVVQRHRDKLRALFAQRYCSQFGDGLTMRTSERETRFEYRPASETLLKVWFDHPMKSIAIPNVLGISSQFKPIVELWTSAVEELRRFDRAQRKSSGNSLTAEMYEALPVELRQDDHPDFDRWYSVLGRYTNEDAWALVPVSELAAVRGIAPRVRLTRKQCEELLHTADVMQLCVEPDARQSGQCYRWNDRVSVFPGNQDSSSDLNSYHAASLLLRLGMTVATADGTVSTHELTTITKHLQEQFSLSTLDSTRLEHLAYVLTHTDGDAIQLGKKLSNLPLDQRQVIGEFLVAVAAADAVITPEETKALRKAYRSIGLDVASLESLAAGRVQCEDAGSDQAPVLVLDHARIRQIMSETEKVAGFLQSVMLDDANATADEHVSHTGDELSNQFTPTALTNSLVEHPIASIPVLPRSGAIESGLQSKERFQGLERKYHAFLEHLLTKAEWTKTALDTAARDHQIMLGGALEAINEWSLESVGDWLVDEAESAIFVRSDLLQPAGERPATSAERGR